MLRTCTLAAAASRSRPAAVTGAASRTPAKTTARSSTSGASLSAPISATWRFQGSLIGAPAASRRLPTPTLRRRSFASIGHRSLPLEGVTVVSIEQAIAAPFCTRQLADLGARVIKVERPGVGDFARDYDSTVFPGYSSHFVWTNRSKESLTLDVKNPKAKSILLRLLETADVFVHNLAPGAIERLGLGAADLHKINPALIDVSISGYGSGGKYEKKKAYDLLVQCEAGCVSTTGTPETPSKVGISVADIAAGTYAYSGVLTALYERERTRAGGGDYEGAILEVSMLEALGEWMGFPAYYTNYGSHGQPPRTGSSHSTISPYGAFTCGDGKQVFFGIQNEREWVRFCEQVLGDASLVYREGSPDNSELAVRFKDNPSRLENRGQVTQVVEEGFRGLTAQEAADKLEGSQIANARLRDMRDFWSHEQLVARGRFRKVDVGGKGEVDALLPPVTVLNRPEPRMAKIPEIGEHTHQILAELGYGDADIAELRGEKAI